MRLQIRHTTVFGYSESINEAYTEMRLRPLDAAGQRCYRFSLTTEPRGEVMTYVDRYGNVVHHFDTLQSHDRVVVTATSDVETPAEFLPEERELTPLDLFDFLTPSGYAPEDRKIADFANSCRHEGDSLETAMALMEATWKRMTYQPGATDVRTKASESLELGRGVCQDFAHVMIAACRSLAIPARYVSGYLYSPRLVRERKDAGIEVPDNAASHAWVDVHIAGQGWISLDPTHNSRQTDQYVRVATGRDYADVPPTRGIYKGNARETLTVQVEVRSGGLTSGLN